MMAITANANNKKFTFPDGTTQEQMGAAIDEFFSSKGVNQLAKQVETTKDIGFGDQLSRQLGLTVRAGVEGVLGIPAIAADALGAALSLIPGIDFGSTTKAISQALTDLGVPVPETSQERIVGAAAKALTGAGSTVGAGQLLTQAAPRAAEILSAAPGVQALSAAGGGTSSEAAKEGGAGVVGQIAAGLAGGLAAPGVVSAAKGTVAALRPTAAAKLRETGRAVSGTGKLIDQLAELGEKSVLADVSPGFKGLAQGVVGRTPSTRQLAESELSDRTKDLSNRLSLKVSEILGKDGDIFQDTGELLAKRAAQAKPLYEKAYAQPIQGDSRKLTKLLETDAVKQAIPRARRIASNEGRKLPEDLSKANVRTWDDIKQGLDDVIQANTTEFGKLNKVGASVVNVKRRLLNVLDENKDYKKARATFAGDSEMLNALKFGGDALGTKMSVSEVRATFAAMNPAEKDAALSGIAGAIKNQVGRVKQDSAAATNFIGTPNNKAKIEALVGEAGFNKLKRFVDTEVTFRKTMAELVGGSQTQLRRAAEESVNKQINIEDPTKRGIANILAKGFGKLTGITDDEALKLTRLTATPRGKADAIRILKSKDLTGSEIRSALVPLTELSAEITAEEE